MSDLGGFEPHAPAGGSGTPTPVQVWAAEITGYLDGTFWFTVREGSAGGPTDVWTADQDGTYRYRVISAWGVLAPGKAWRVDCYKNGPADSNWGDAVAVTSASCAVGAQVIESTPFELDRGETLALASIADAAAGVSYGRLTIWKEG